MLNNENNPNNEMENENEFENTPVNHYCNEEPEIITTEDFTLENTKPEKKPKKKKANPFVLAVIACIVCSIVFSAASSYAVARHINKLSENAYEENLPTQEVKPEVYVSEESMTTIKIAEKASPSVVEISTESIATSIFMQQYITGGAGSGVILTEDGYIVTNYHVIDNVSKVTVTLNNGEAYSAVYVGGSPENDLAVIKINATGLVPAEFADSDSLVVGQKAIAIGNPLGSLGGTVTEGIISALDRDININGTPMNLLQTSAAINPGNSGGGLFDENARLVGIVNSKSSGSEIEGLGFAIPSNTVKSVTDEIIENDDTPASNSGIKLGITVVEILDERTAAMYRVDKMGVYIVSVDLNSNAFNAGLQAGDCITEVGGKTIEKSDDIAKALTEYSAGDSIEITYIRNGAEHKSQTLLAASR